VGVRNTGGQAGGLFFRFAFDNRDGDGGAKVVWIMVFGKPKHGALKIAKGLDVHAAHAAEKGKIANAAVNVVLVKNSEALLTREAGLAKGPNERGQLRGGKVRPGQDGQSPQIQHGAVEAAFTAGVREALKRFFAGFEIEMFIGIKTDEFTCADDVQCYGHNLPPVDGDGFKSFSTITVSICLAEKPDTFKKMPGYHEISTYCRFNYSLAASAPR
jgi:hypothetical protein